MQTDNGNVVKTSTASHHALVGFVELAAQVTKARGAILWITGDGSAGIVASAGLDVDQSLPGPDIVRIDRLRALS